MRMAICLAACLLGAPASASVRAIDVPAMCGPANEVFATLAGTMPEPKAVGVGSDRNGNKVATLFTGNGYWALIALVTNGEVCVVASGHDWQPADAVF